MKLSENKWSRDILDELGINKSTLFCIMEKIWIEVLAASHNLTPVIICSESVFLGMFQTIMVITHYKRYNKGKFKGVYIKCRLTVRGERVYKEEQK